MKRAVRRRSAQRGIAAVEFALVLGLLVVLLHGISTFGAALYIQQAVSRAAEDGARAAPLLPAQMMKTSPAAAMEQIRGAVRESLAGSLVVPSTGQLTEVQRRGWIASNVPISVVASNLQVTVTVSYPYGQNRVLPALPLVDASRWLPQVLTSRATAVLPS